jgi:hypothetical protein
MDEIDQSMRFENTDGTILVMDENDHVIYMVMYSPHIIHVCFVHNFIILLLPSLIMCLCLHKDCMFTSFPTMQANICTFFLHYQLRLQT